MTTPTTSLAQPYSLACAAVLGLFAGALPCHAAVTWTLGGGGSITNNPLSVTVTGLHPGGTAADTPDPNPPSRAWDNNGTAMVFSGDLPAFGPADSITFAIDPFDDSSLTGTTLNTLPGDRVDMGRNVNTGWSVLGGPGGQRIGGTEVLVLTFTDIPDGLGLRLTAVAGDNPVNGPQVQVVVDGSSVTNLGGLSASGLSIDIQEGQRVGFRNATASGEFRVRELTLETFVIPEPSALLLLGLGGSLTLLRRRR